MSAAQPRFHIGPDSDEARQLMDAIDRWLARDVAPQVMKLEHDDTWPAEIALPSLPGISSMPTSSPPIQKYGRPRGSSRFSTAFE